MYANLHHIYVHVGRDPRVPHICTKTMADSEKYELQNTAPTNTITATRFCREKITRFGFAWTAPKITKTSSTMSDSIYSLLALTGNVQKSTVLLRRPPSPPALKQMPLPGRLVHPWHGVSTCDAGSWVDRFVPGRQSWISQASLLRWSRLLQIDLFVVPETLCRHLDRLKRRYSLVVGGSRFRVYVAAPSCSQQPFELSHFPPMSPVRRPSLIRVPSMSFPFHPFPGSFLFSFGE